MCPALRLHRQASQTALRWNLFRGSQTASSNVSVRVILANRCRLRRVLAPAAAASAAETAAGEHIEDIFKPAETVKPLPLGAAGAAAHMVESLKPN